MYHSRNPTDRQVIAAVREHDALIRRRYQIIQLEQPIQRGWRRHYVLSQAANEQADSITLAAILKVIGSIVVSPRRDFLRRRGRQKKFVEIEQPLHSIPIHEWQRQDYSRWRAYFRIELVLERNQHWQPHCVFTQPSLFELRVERNWQWHYREVDPAIETRLSELNRWLESRAGWQRYGWLKGRTQHYRWRDEASERQKIFRREDEREMSLARQIFPEVDPCSFRQRIQISRRENGFRRKQQTPPSSSRAPGRRNPTFIKRPYEHQRPDPPRSASGRTAQVRACVYPELHCSGK